MNKLGIFKRQKKVCNREEWKEFTADGENSRKVVMPRREGCFKRREPALGTYYGVNKNTDQYNDINSSSMIERFSLVYHVRYPPSAVGILKN